MVNHVSVCLEMVLVSVQDRCTVWAKHNISSKIILDEADGTPRLMWLMWNLVLVCSATMLVSEQDRYTFCAKRIIGLEIIL
jgi:hypothetical protein